MFIKTQTLLAFVTCSSLLTLAACDGTGLNLPPVFSSNLHVYAADNGSDVPFTIKAYSSPSTVTCFANNVTLSHSAGDDWTGTADYTNDLIHHSSGTASGTNTVSCSATNTAGTTAAVVGVIEIIPNVAPNPVITQPMSICGNDGSRQYSDALIDASSTYLAGASFTLTHGTLPIGLGIEASTGKLVGTMAAGSQTVTGLQITATTAAGTTESLSFTVDISSAPCI